MPFVTTLVAGEDFDVALQTDDGSGAWLGLSVVCCLKPPGGSQIDVAGELNQAGSAVRFRVLGSVTVGWPAVNNWAVELWSGNGSGSRDQIDTGLLHVVPSGVNPP